MAGDPRPILHFQTRLQIMVQNLQKAPWSLVLVQETLESFQDWLGAERGRLLTHQQFLSRVGKGEVVQRT